MIFFSDFDNTLYLHDNPDGTAKNLAAIEPFRKARNKFCLATGRSYSSINRVLPNFANYVDYLVLDNGAVCVDANGKEIFDFPISIKTTSKIVHYIKETFPNEETANVFYYDMTEHSDFSCPVTKFRCWTKDKAISRRIIAGILARFGDDVKAFVASDTRPSGLSWVSDDYTSFIDVAPIEAGKEQAIAKLADIVAPNERIITIGDSDNDNVMLITFDGYAVENGDLNTLRAVKKEHIVPTVADLLEKLVEENKWQSQ